MNSPSLFFLLISLFLGPLFHVTLPWFISSTPAAELDRIIIGSRNLLMNLQRSRRAASSHVRSLDAGAIDPKSHSQQSDATFFYTLLSFATQPTLNALNLKGW